MIAAKTKIAEAIRHVWAGIIISDTDQKIHSS